MKILINPSEQELESALIRPQLQSNNLDSIINEVFLEVKSKGDPAVKKYSEKYDKVQLVDFLVQQNEFEEAERIVSGELKEAIQVAALNIERFHKSQIMRETEVETSPGVLCWRKSLPIQKVGMYIPGGTAPLFSTVLMLGIPASIACCPTRVLCTPPNSEGKIHPAILYAAKLAGINTVFKVGGAQAIAALALGTETIPKVDKIFGPGNQYVTAAKMYAQQLGVAIDLPAGPSEVLVAADNTIPPKFVAADLLAQAEHGADSQVVFLTNSESYLDDVKTELKSQLEALPRAEIAQTALANSVGIISKTELWCNVINQYAPEHLIVMGKNEEMVVEGTVNAGSIFIGLNTAESFGDYASGTNHTLPTAGYAKAYSGVSLDSFVKKITYQKVTNEGLMNLGPVVVKMAEAEELKAHANAIRVRMNESQIDTNVDPIRRFVRPDFRDIQAYSSARDEFNCVVSLSSEGKVFLDANENPLFDKYNRYPDPLQKELKSAISQLKDIPAKNLFLGNGSDEVLDLIFRLTTTPFIDEIAVLNPSYGMYSILAKMNGLKIKSIDLNENFKLSKEEILLQAEGCKLLVICNPNNPTGGIIEVEELLYVIRKFQGLVIIDEAYIDFCPEFSLVNYVNDNLNLMVVQTLSKAFGMAGLRIGIAIGHENWIKELNKIKPPYNLSSLVQVEAIERLKNQNWFELNSAIISERERLEEFLKAHVQVKQVFPSDANFILFRIDNAEAIYEKLIKQGIVVRNRSKQFKCENTLRVSVGNRMENNKFMNAMCEL